jgi:glycosyltransferase involved in cell wall biosynthesis
LKRCFKLLFFFLRAVGVLGGPILRIRLSQSATLRLQSPAVRIVGLVESTDHVCCRYRLQAFAHGLAQSGHHLELLPLGRGLARWGTLGSVDDADVVVLQRKLLSPWELSRLRRHARRLIFDFDDAVFLRDSYHPRGNVSGTRLRRFAATVTAADSVIVGNDWLAKKAPVMGARHVSVIPTCVDPSIYPVAKHERTHTLTGVWIGSSSTLNGLERHRELLEQIGRAVPGLILRLVCDRSMELANWRVVHWPWSAETEAKALATSDIGLSMLPDDDWSRGKCGLKVLQYLAAGLPVVGNPVGVTAELTGDAGIMVDTVDQWKTALERLRDPNRRRAMGEAGRQRVVDSYGVDIGLRHWRTLLGNLAAKRQAG